MTTSHRFERSRTYPVAVETAFDVVLGLPLNQLFNHRFGPIPAIKEARLHSDDFASVGASRTIVLNDGGTMREELTDIDRPRLFRYRITELTGPTKLLVDSVEGAWSFAPAGSGVRVSWTWDVAPKSNTSAKVLPVFGRFWSGYARRALEVLEDHLVD